MNNITDFKSWFESIPEQREVVLLVILIRRDGDTSNECGFLKDGFKRLYEEYEKILNEENEDCPTTIIKQEESIIEVFQNK